MPSVVKHVILCIIKKEKKFLIIIFEIPRFQRFFESELLEAMIYSILKIMR